MRIGIRGDFRLDSDIDVLVEFDPDHVPGLAFFSMERELSEIFDQRVDLNTPLSLSRYFRDEVLMEAKDYRRLPSSNMSVIGCTGDT